MSRLAVISGTGLENFPLMQDAEREVVRTPYGEAVVYRRDYEGHELVFLPRHGKEHSVPPHLINYRANIAALQQLGLEQALAFFCVGSLRRELPPGSLTLVDQFIDQTWGREHTFSELGRVIHSDMTEPYCPRLRRALSEAAAQAEITLDPQATYICTQGPRLETSAEIRAYQSWGADIVGMTGVPETALAREAGICYAAVAVVANYGAGMEDSIDVAEISRVMIGNSANLHHLLLAYLALPEGARDCRCGGA